MTERWTQQKVAALKDMWARNFTCREIAKWLGEGFSRNAVIGKAHRLGLPSRPNPCRRTYTRTDPAVLAERARQYALARYHERKPTPTKAPLPRMRLDPVKRCLNIPNDPKVDPTPCNEPAVLDKPWCPECYRRLVIPVKTKEAA